MSSKSECNNELRNCHGEETVIVALLYWYCVVVLMFLLLTSKVLLQSDKVPANFSDRSLLKNLGHWLGLQTLARNKPILMKVLNDICSDGCGSVHVLKANCSFWCLFIQRVDKKFYRHKAGNSIGKQSIVAQVMLSFVYGLERSFIFLAGPWFEVTDYWSLLQRAAGIYTVVLFNTITAFNAEQGSWQRLTQNVNIFPLYLRYVFISLPL